MLSVLSSWKLAAKPTIEVVIRPTPDKYGHDHIYEIDPTDVEALYSLLDSLREKGDLKWGTVVAKLWQYMCMDPHPHMVKQSLMTIAYALETWPAGTHMGRIDT